MAGTPPTYKEIEKLLCEDGGVGKLREQGFDPSRWPPDNLRMTYILIACRKGDLRVVRGLLELGASATATTNGGFTALIYACNGSKKERAELAECLLERADVRACIDSAATSGYWSGRTALYIAAVNGNAAVVRVLLCCGADATKLDDKGRTAAACARKWGKEEVAKLIEDHTALLALDEWRPWNHNEFPHLFRAAARTFVLLAKISSF